MNYRETGTILDRIVARKAARLAGLKEFMPVSTLAQHAACAPGPRDFGGAIKGEESVSLIAEIKKASPSRGVLRERLDVPLLAKEYEAAGAAAVSVITEQDFFLGDPEFIAAAADAITLPVLRKDFIFDLYQIHESRALRADAVLLIVAILEDELLGRLLKMTQDYGMAALVEVHRERELERALAAGGRIIGINNRDLKTMHVDIATTEKIISHVPEEVTVVSESGIHTREDFKRAARLGVDAVLVGEAIVTSQDPGAKIAGLLRKAE